MITVYTTGVYDILHRGHINILVKARNLGDSLVVGVQDDDGVYDYKGSYPVMSTLERVAQLEALPFVDKVIIYHGVDQRPYLKDVSPGIMVQGDDWLKTGERDETIEYLKANKIRLVLIPYTEGISTTEIKRRVMNVQERSDKDFIMRRVKLVEIEKLKLYERFDEQKVLKLVKKIDDDGCFFNPITINEYKIVIDGVNRLEALKRLGVKYVTALEVDYRDVDLLANTHYKKHGKVVRMSEFGDTDGEKISFPRYSKDDIIRMTKAGTMLQNGVTWHRVKYSVARLRVPLQYLVSGFDFTTYIQEIVDKGNIRYYPANTYICDEWE